MIENQSDDASSNRLPETYLDLIEKVGGKGKYQYIFVTIQAVAFFITGVVLMSDAFIFNNPSFDCTAFGLLTNDCYSTVCSLPSDQWASFVTDEAKKFRSLANSFGSTYFCDDQIYLNLYSTAPFLGTTIGGIFLGIMADNIGRKKAILIGNIVTVVGCIMLVFSQQLWMASLALVFCGSGTDAVSTIYYSLGVECINDNLRQKVMAFVPITFVFGALFATLFYYLYQDWLITSIYCLLIPAVVCAIVATYFTKESPMYLARQSPEKALKQINEIGEMNKGQANILKIQDIQNVMRCQQTEKNNVRSNILDVFRYKSLRGLTIALGIACMAQSMMYYGPSLIIDQFGFDIYTSSTALNLADLLTYLPLMFIIDKVGRKKCSSLLYAIATAVSIALIFIVAPAGCDMCSTLFVQLALVFVFRFCVSMVYVLVEIYATELYPTRVRNIGIGVLSIFDTAASTVAPLVMGAFIRAQVNPFILFTALGLAAISCIFFCPQTFGKLCPQEIQQVLAIKQSNKSQLSPYQKITQNT